MPQPTDDPTAPPYRADARVRLTLADVAAALGVSRTTVSNAFNRPQQLSKALREDILAKARELGYYGPDPAARALRSNAIHAVAVVFHHDLRYALSDPPSLAFLRGVARELDARQLHLQLIPKLGRRVELGAAFQATADALIVHAEIDPALAPEAAAARKPLVLVDAFVAGVTTVGTQDRHGGELAMAHALRARPDRVLVLSFPLDPAGRRNALELDVPPPSGYIASERMAGYVQAARAAGYPLDRVDWIEVDERFPEAAAEALAPWRDRVAPGTRLAVVAMSDRMALAAQPVVAAWTGVERAALVGFDDIPAAAPAGLTTVRQDAERKGELAVQALLDGLTTVLLPVELVVRDT